MNVKQALKEQYHAGLAMLADCVRLCPEELWVRGQYPRYYWRIAFHAAFFTHLYLGPDLASFRPWPGRREGIYEGLWEHPERVEPYELPESAEMVSQKEMLSYIAYVDSVVDSTVEALDLAASECGFSWYPNTTKLSHQMMNLRHIPGHVGQLSELLMAHAIDIEWIADEADLRARSR